MAVQHHVVRVPVKLLEGKTGRIAVVDLRNRGAKRAPGLFGVLSLKSFDVGGKGRLGGVGVSDFDD